MRFSIVTVTRNNLAGLRETACSLAAQTFRDVQWVVVDGASTDGTATYLKQTSAAWISEPDNGIYDAMNKGIDRAHGDNLLFLNAGDTLYNMDTLEILAARQADFIYGDAREGDHYKRARPHTRAALGMFTHHQAMLYRRETVRDLRFDLRYGIAADYKFTLEFLRRAGSVLYHPAAICRFAPGGISQIQVRRGRREQYDIRRELRVCSPPENIAILLGQMGLMGLRRTLPGVYWAMKRAHNSST